MTTQFQAILPSVRIPVRTERLSPQSFSSVYSRERDNIKSIKVIPPQIGKMNDFGELEVTYKVLKLSER